MAAHHPHTCWGCRPEYAYASILCHIHSTTHWTQEVVQISSYLHDILQVVFSTSNTTAWHASNRWARPRRHSSLSCVEWGSVHRCLQLQLCWVIHIEVMNYKWRNRFTQNGKEMKKYSLGLCSAETYAPFSACKERDRVSASEAHSAGPGGLWVPEGDWQRSFWRGKNLTN